MKNKKVSITYFLLAFALIIASRALTKIAKVPAGYKAKIACSEIFVSGRQTDNVIATNFDNISPFFDLVGLDVNDTDKTVKASLLGFGKSKAIYRDNIGCSLEDRSGLIPVIIPPVRTTNLHVYEKNVIPAVQETLLPLFDDSDMVNPIMTRGVVVVQNNKIIAEQYTDGFDENTRQQSWSTAKGVVQALIGIAVRDDYLSLDDTALLPEWEGDTAKTNISIAHLLHMASGLEFNEAYANPNSHVDQMLFNQRDMGGYAAARKLISKPGTESRYSSGTTNILSKILRVKLENSGVDYHAFPQRELFNKISMSSAIFEVDAIGNFIGSSYIYATPRDFARFGQLYLQDGIWEGERVLPETWVEYTRQPAPKSNGNYGSHWSLNTSQSTLPGLPESVIHLGGNDGQMIIVIPSKNAVIVRMGVTRHPATLENDLYPYIRDIYESL